MFFYCIINYFGKKKIQDKKKSPKTKQKYTRNHHDDHLMIVFLFVFFGKMISYFWIITKICYCTFLRIWINYIFRFVCYNMNIDHSKMIFDESADKPMISSTFFDLSDTKLSYHRVNYQCIPRLWLIYFTTIIGITKLDVWMTSIGNQSIYHTAFDMSNYVDFVHI